MRSLVNSAHWHHFACKNLCDFSFVIYFHSQNSQYLMTRKTYRKYGIKFVNTYPFEKLMESTEDLDSTKSKLMTYLKACTNVLNMCYLPINACIICFLYSQNLEDNMPKTETEVYKSLVVAIVLRKLRLDNPSSQLHSLEDLRGDDKECYSRICSLAFNMTVECKQIVHELPLSLDSLNKSPFRGLLTIDRTSKLDLKICLLSFISLFKSILQPPT